MTKLRTRIKNILYTYRYDIIGLIGMIIIIQWFFAVLVEPGQVVFSDLDFPFSSRRYYEQIIGIWNGRFNTTAMLNTPRFLSLLPSYIISILAGFDGTVLLKVFLLQNIYLSAITFYLFLKRLLRIYYNPKFNGIRIIILVIGSIYYALNPWVIFRIQHIYLLVGYSLFPFVLLQFFKLYDHKFQAVVTNQYDHFEHKLYKQNIIDTAIMAFAISFSAGAIHYFFYTAFLVAGLLALLVLKYLLIYRKERLKKRWYILAAMIKKSTLLGILIVGFSAFWLMVYVLSIVLGVQASQNNVNVLDTYTSFSKYSQFSNVFYMISYWWPMISLDVFGVYFFVGGAIIIGLALIGFISSIRHNHVVLFLGLLGLVLAILATGVYYDAIAPWFLLFVKLPVIGSMFRDPNKLAGLLALCMGVSFVFGMDVVLEALDKIPNKVVIQSIFVAISFTGVIMFIYPMKVAFVDNYYKPVEQPKAYKALNEFLLEEEIDYAIYLPLADEMLKDNKVASPKWNMIDEEWQKSTGDFHVYNSMINTLFQFEGNDVAIGFYLRFIQHLLDEGRTDDVAEYIRLLGSNTLIYHDEYYGQDQRQDENKKMIESDERYQKIYENDIFSVYQIDDFDRNKAVYSNEYIYTTKGFDLTCTLFSSDAFDLIKTPVIYGNQTDNGYETTKALESMDVMIDTTSRIDLIMSHIPKEYKNYPFNWINEGNPYLKWSKTYATNIDWSWLLKSQNVHDRDYAFDLNGGLAVTLASNALDVLPYKRDSLSGETVLNFNQMLEEELFFVADNEELFDIESNPYIGEINYQNIHGTLIQGDPKDIWQVAKSGVFKVKADTPYRFELLISGRFVQSLHLKARFYDEAMNELGIQYVVAPEEVSEFDTMDFYGEVVSPPRTVYMRLDLLSYQRPESKSYWWIHDVVVEDLSEFVGPNTINGNYSIAQSGRYKIMMRNYTSKVGSEMILNINDKSYEINTKGELNEFDWYDLGEMEFEAGEIDIELTAKGGFAAVNCIVIVPLDVWNKTTARINQWGEKNRNFVAVESSNAMIYDNQLQSEKTYNTLSMGKGLAIDEGLIKHTFSIMKDSDYIIEPSWVFPYIEKGEATLQLMNDNGSITDLLNYSGGEEEIEKHQVKLEKGNYTAIYNINSEALNYAPIETMSPFYGEAIFIEKVIDDPYMSDCSECEKITMDMMRHTIQEDVLMISYDKTCSCDWYIYSSDLLKVHPGQEWYIRYEARSDYVTKRHGKMIFMDDEGIPISIAYISEVEEKDKVKWNFYEQIVEVPEDAVTAYFQFWTRGSKKENGLLEVKNLFVQKYSDFITLDHLLIYEAKSDVPKTEEVLHNTFLSPNPNWVATTGSPQVKLNGVTQGYLISKETIDNNGFGLKLILSPVYNIGFVIFLVTCMGFVVFILIVQRRRE